MLDSYANPRLRLGFAWLSRILPTPLVFISGYANTENVFYCLLSGKAQVQEVEGHAAEDQKQLNPNFELVNKPSYG